MEGSKVKTALQCVHDNSCCCLHGQWMWLQLCDPQSNLSMSGDYAHVQYMCRAHTVLSVACFHMYMYMYMHACACDVYVFSNISGLLSPFGVGDSTGERCLERHSPAGDQLLDEPGARSEQDPLSQAQLRGPAHSRCAQGWQEIPRNRQLRCGHRSVMSSY